MPIVAVSMYAFDNSLFAPDNENSIFSPP